MARISHSINESELNIPSTGTFRWTTPMQPTIKYSDSSTGWNCRTSLVAPRIDCIPPATARNSKYAPTRSTPTTRFKYFGKGQGVSVYSFIDERDLLFHSLVFSAGERESAYVIDGLMHNDVVRSDIHSTDSFGFSEAILEDFRQFCSSRMDTSLVHPILGA